MLRRLGAAALVAVGLTAAAGRGAARAADAPVGSVLTRPALTSRLAAHAVLLDVTRAGARLVAVGERGIVVYSDDGGLTWTQAAVPVSVTLTAVRFADPQRGFAVGHSGVVLVTTDGGTTWTLRLDGIRAAALALTAAQAAARRTPGSGQLRLDVTHAEQLVRDGPDKPFLGLWVFDAQRLVVVGAYGLAFETRDAGRSWTSWMGRVADLGGRHLYAIAAHGATIYLAGEQGLLERSTDGGASFVRVRSPYRGTYFVAAVLPSGALFVGGLRGHAFLSRDGERTFTRVSAGASLSLSGVEAAPDGGLVVTTQSGQLLRWRPGARALEPLAARRTVALGALSGVAYAPDGGLLVVGVTGATRL
jgi:photosystem II stability/assembly factor-like uncharacterized protein